MRASKKWNQMVLPFDLVSARFGAEPKPCPFCGCPYVGLYLSPSPHMTCADCGADGPTFEGNRETLEMRQGQAFKAWNGSMPRPIMLSQKAI